MLKMPFIVELKENWTNMLIGFGVEYSAVSIAKLGKVVLWRRRQ